MEEQNNIKILLILIFIIIIISNYSKEHFQNAFQDRQFEKKIYTYLDDNSSKLEVLNIENLKKNTPDTWEIIVLTNKNLGVYIDNKFIKKNKNTKLRKFINLLSLQVIYEKGGIWIDPNINILNGNYFKKYYTEMFYQGYDCCIFEISYHKYSFYKKNFIIMAPSGSTCLKRIIFKLSTFFSIDFDTYIKNYIPRKIKSKLKELPKTNNDMRKLIYYSTILSEYQDSNRYEVFTRKDKRKRFHGIKLSKTNNRDILNMQISNYKFMNKFI